MQIPTNSFILIIFWSKRKRNNFLRLWVSRKVDQNSSVNISAYYPDFYKSVNFSTSDYNGPWLGNSGGLESQNFQFSTNLSKSFL